MAPGEICLAWFPFGDVPGMKLRPVLLLTEPIGPTPEVVAAYITSVVPNSLVATDIVLDPKRPEDAATNLKVVSVLRLHKIASIHCASVVRTLGRLSPSVQVEVSTRLRSMLRL